MKTKQDYNFYLKRFQEVICFLTAIGIKKNFKTIGNYRSSKNSSKAYYLNIKYESLARLSRLPQGKKCFEEFLQKSSELFVYHRHCHKTFRKNKKFARNAWFELSESVLARWFEDEKNFNTNTCSLISKTTHKWIDKYIFNYKDGKKIIDNSDIPEEEEEENKLQITKEELQVEINKQHCSRFFAKKAWKILNGSDEDFKESRYGWSIEDTESTKLWRKDFLRKFYGKVDTETFCELSKLCGVLK